MLGAAEAKAETIAVIEKDKENRFNSRMDVAEKAIKESIGRGEYNATIWDSNIRDYKEIIKELERIGYKVYYYQRDRYTTLLRVEWRD